jgi:hypothetical protein
VVVAVMLMGGALGVSGLIAQEAPPPPSSEEEGPVKECLDAASRDYNDCLMEAGTRWGRFMCDLIYESDAALCWSRQLGEIRKAWEGRADEELN